MKNYLSGKELDDWINEKPKAECSVCGRKTWDESEIAKPCKMPQPNGKLCSGVMYKIH